MRRQCTILLVVITLVQCEAKVPTEKRRDELLVQIEDARNHLRSYPASCAARERRERAFEELYSLSSSEFGQDRFDVDSAYRIREDFVFSELIYEQSRTCCWNGSTTTMFALIMSYADAEQAGICVQPTVFRAHADGYARWFAHAQSLGCGNEWLPWSGTKAVTKATSPRTLSANRQTLRSVN